MLHNSNTTITNSNNPPSYSTCAGTVTCAGSVSRPARSASSSSRQSPPTTIPEHSTLFLTGPAMFARNASSQSLYPALGGGIEQRGTEAGARCLGCLAEQRPLCLHSMCSQCLCFLCHLPASSANSMMAYCSQCKKNSVVSVKSCAHCNFAMCPECAARHKGQFIAEISKSIDGLKKSPVLTISVDAQTSRLTEMTRMLQLLKLKEQEAIEQVREAYRMPVELCSRALDAHNKSIVSRARIVRHTQSLADYLQAFVQQLIATAESYLPLNCVEHTTHVLKVSSEDANYLLATESVNVPSFVPASQTFEKFVLTTASPPPAEQNIDINGCGFPPTPPPSPDGQQHHVSAVRKICTRVAHVSRYLPRRHQ